MNPTQIRDYAVAASVQRGINPAIPLGIIEHVSSFATKYDRGGKIGLMGVPTSEVQDKAAYLANPKAQIDSGLVRLAAYKGNGTDIDAMIAYTGDAKASMKALLRGLKTTTEPISKAAMQAAYKATGSRGNLDDDAAKYGFEFEQPVQEQTVPRQPARTMPNLPETPMTQEVKSDGWAVDDGKDDDLVAAVFDSGAQSNSTPADVWKQIEAIGAE
jgi:hypothetical protein